MSSRILLPKFGSKTGFIFCLALLLASWSAVNAQENEINKLIEQASANLQSEMISDYSYLMKFSFKRHKLGGRKFTRLYEAIIPTTFSSSRPAKHSLILLEDSEKVISSRDIKLSREKTSKELEEAESIQSTKRMDAIKSNSEDSYWTMGFSENSQHVKLDILELLKSSHLSNLQRKQINGINVILIDFTPKSETKLEKPLSYLSKIEGQIRIDELSQRIIRVEGFPIGTFAVQKENSDENREKDASLFFAQTKVTETIWFPKNIKINLATLPKFYDPVEVEMVFTQYKKGIISTQYEENDSAKNNIPAETGKP